MGSVPAHSSCAGTGELGPGSASTAPCAAAALAAFPPWLAAALQLCWSCCGLSHVLALLQVRNAIQRMKDKKKALSFTVSWEESLLPLPPSATHQRRVPAVLWVCFGERMMERNIFLFLSAFFAVLLDTTDPKTAYPYEAAACSGRVGWEPKQ